MRIMGFRDYTKQKLLFKYNLKKRKDKYYKDKKTYLA